jgi:hypothetical protein
MAFLELRVIETVYEYCRLCDKVVSNEVKVSNSDTASHV